MRILVWFASFLFCTNSLDYRISKNFEHYLVKKYGEGPARKIFRPSLKRSSLGGGILKSGQRTNKVPVVFIHGLGGRAGDYESVHKEFLKIGYTAEELYGMTWGKPGALFIFVDFKCDYVVQIRRFIESVSEFTNSKIDVVGYSMGSPLLRKAILGGRCVDNPSVNLGPPLTNRIQTFVSAGGANYGSHLCKNFASNFCNQRTGLHCRSQYIQDINFKTGYEGSELYAIFNPSDEWIGENSVCGVQPFRLNGAEHIRYSQPSHYGVLWKSANVQAQLISRKYAVASILRQIRSRDWRSIRHQGKHVQSDTPTKIIPKIMPNITTILETRGNDTIEPAEIFANSTSTTSTTTATTATTFALSTTTFSGIILDSSAGSTETSSTVATNLHEGEVRKPKSHRLDSDALPSIKPQSEAERLRAKQFQKIFTTTDPLEEFRIVS